ncbi:hypothetical protein LCGC14_0235210 [marine sediment metagenome]|uniref:Uncharacterized protein n=1 Tax=marine sediment metagenome TaxID=412755 RepID=A0A0F9U8W6_9ZZZZ
MNGDKSVRAIVSEWLFCNDYDGLVSEGCECGCRLGDLVPCDSPCETCIAGYEGPDPEGDYDWMIYLSKKAAHEARKQLSAKENEQD